MTRGIHARASRVTRKGGSIAQQHREPRLRIRKGGHSSAARACCAATQPLHSIFSKRPSGVRRCFHGENRRHYNLILSSGHAVALASPAPSQQILNVHGSVAQPAKSVVSPEKQRSALWEYQRRRRAARRPLASRRAARSAASVKRAERPPPTCDIALITCQKRKFGTGARRPHRLRT